MQKILCALVAVCSLMAANLRPTQAQNAGPAADPTPAPQQMDETNSKYTPHVQPVPHTGVQGEMVIGPEEHVADVATTDRRLVLQGHVDKDVLAVNCEVLIEKGATVGGHVVLVGGSVVNHAGEAVKVVQQDPGLGDPLRRAMQPNLTSIAMGNWMATTGRLRTEPPANQHNWPGGQFALLVLGLLGALLLRIAAPRATEEIAEAVALRPGRCLLVGGASALVIALVLTANAVLLKSESGFGMVWKPFGVAIAIAPFIPLMLGWLAGMRYIGNLVARRLGRPEQAGLFGRMVLGLFLFFAVNLFAGLLNEGLGVIGLGLECVVAVMGLGATLMTGFGTRPEWLTAR